MLIGTSEALAHFCNDLRAAPYITVDTEFMGEKTFFPKLCLVQVAHGEHAAAIDPLSGNLDLSPLAELLANPDIVKVMHSGRQDLQILQRETGALAAPFFDTQIAAAFCGMGEQPGYDTLVRQLLEIDIDKASQATDWSLRPLSDRQIDYALGDVTHLCGVYERITVELVDRGRRGWVTEEMDALLDPARYESRPREAYRRIKLRRPSPRTLAILRELAAWREETAIARDLPRGWIIRDDALAEIAQSPPRDRKQLARVRGIKEQIARGDDGQTLLDLISAAVAMPQSEWPTLPAKPAGLASDESMVALLQALLRLRCTEHQIAARMVATRSDLEQIAMDPEADIPVLHGWRREIFGADALALRDGRLGLTGNAGRVVTTR